MCAKVNNRVSVHKGRVFELWREQVTLSNGITTDMDIIRHPGASAIVPFSENRDLVLIRQYRHAVGNFIWEIPAGTLNHGEEPLECARRELIEETGYSAGTWHELGEIIPVPGYSDERVHIFLAADLSRAHQNLDRDEILDVHMVGLEQALLMITKGEIQDGKTVSGLFMASLWLNNKKQGGNL
jgi:nudix-type nucleoside diphosphatase (YffH/AdpP family)